MPPPPHTASVSVVLCTYNGQAYLQQQLESIAAQTLLPKELIASDDRSSDATPEILRAFARHAPFPVKITQNELNLGCTANFDQAMQRATGDLIALSDQDDLWLPHKLETLVPALQNDPALGAVFSDATLLEHTPNPSPRVPAKSLWSVNHFSPSKQRAITSRDTAVKLLLQADVITGATLLLRSSLRSLWHPIPRSWVHDSWISWMLSLHSRIQPVPEPLMFYRLHAQQQLGVGATGSLLQRLASVQRNGRARYTRVADQFEALLQHLQTSDDDPATRQLVREKISLLRRRAALPHQAVSRAFSILGHSTAYHRYARGWRSMRKDLFLT